MVFWYYIRNNIVCKTLVISSLIITNFPIQQQLKILEIMILHFLKNFTYIVQWTVQFHRMQNIYQVENIKIAELSKK